MEDRLLTWPGAFRSCWRLGIFTRLQSWSRWIVDRLRCAVPNGGRRGRPEPSLTRCSRRLRILQPIRLPSQRRCRGSPTTSGCTT